MLAPTAKSENSAPATGKSKLAHLEAMRGIAALVVVAYHFGLAFNAHFQPGSPWYLLVNGGAAVTFFFVLSGYVLSLRPLQTQDSFSVFHAIIKRWPRLAGPVLIAVLFSWLLWRFDAFWHAQAALITGSDWLATGAGGIPLGQPTPDHSLWAALAQGSWRTFFRGDSYFDSVLWTMRWEFYGSGIIFVTLAILIAARSRQLQAIIIVLIMAPLAYRSAYYLAFCLGLALAWLRCLQPMQITRTAAISIVAVSLYLLGYEINTGYYAWIPAINSVQLYAVASTALIGAVIFCPHLQSPLDGRIGRLLGRYSFPVYLTHTLAILSVGAMTLAFLLPTLGLAGAACISIAVSLIATIATAHALAVFEGWWVPKVNAFADAVVVRCRRLLIASSRK